MILQHLLEGSDKQLWFAGHSLGEATATLAAAVWEINSETTPVTGIYTYGQPRVGNKGFANNFARILGSKMFRIVNNNGLVTQLPNIGYQHVGVEKYFMSDGLLVDGDRMMDWERGRDRALGKIKDLGRRGVDAGKDRTMGNWDGSPVEESYITLLKSLLWSFRRHPCPGTVQWLLFQILRG